MASPSIDQVQIEASVVRRGEAGVGIGQKGNECAAMSC